MISYDFGMHRAGVLLHLLLLACRAGGRRGEPKAGARACECCAITVWVTDSASVLAIKIEIGFSMQPVCFCSGSRVGCDGLRECRRHACRYSEEPAIAGYDSLAGDTGGA